MGIYKYDVYRSPNIGLFVKSNNSILSVPFGFAETKAKKLRDYLDVDKMFYASVSGTRLIGPLTVMNNNGIILPSTASEEELQLFKQESKLNVDRLNSKFTAVGNLISANDNGALVSSLIKAETHQQIRDILGVQVDTLSIAGFV
ncbi:MAG: hypothetical protein WBL54_05795, partial [Nitrososphaeraceae archaeon]